MSIKGFKVDLVSKLLQGVEEGVVIGQHRPAVEVQNSAGGIFHLGAYWKLLQQNGLELDESFFKNVDGVRFSGSTEVECESRLCPKKGTTLKRLNVLTSSAQLCSLSVQYLESSSVKETETSGTMNKLIRRLFSISSICSKRGLIWNRTLLTG